MVRVGAIACIASAVLSVVALVGFAAVVGSRPIAEAATTTAFFVPAVAALGAVLCLGVGLVGLFAYQQPRMGGLGVTAFVVALVGTLLAAGAQWTYVFVLPHFAGPAPELVNVGAGSVLAGFLLSYLVLSVGWVLVGVAALRAGIFPRGLAILLIVGAVLAFLPLPSRTLVLSLAVGFLGWRIARTSTS